MPRLLWMDDEGARKFLYEDYKLKQQGWQIDWATSVDEAVHALCTRPYDAILIDQMMPLGGVGQQYIDVWTGCLLLWWLRRGTPPDVAPPPTLEASSALWEVSPLEANRTTPTICVSAFDDPDIRPVMLAASETEALRVPVLVKPIRFADLLDALEAARARP